MSFNVRTELPPEAWRGYRRAGFPHGSWRIEGGVLRACAGAEALDLISRKYYHNFILELEWCLPAAGNSGILYRVSEDAAEAWRTGPELQLLDDRDHPDSRKPETSCGALYDLLGPDGTHFPADGEFKAAKLVVRGRYVEHWLNGIKVLGYDLEDPALHSKIAQSKFKDCPQFARQHQGHLVLQHHSTDAWFRAINIEELPG